MQPKKRKIISDEDRFASEIYKKKLRSYKQDSSPSETAVEKHRPAKVAKKKLERQKQKLETLIKDENEKYTFKNPRPQRFSLPESIIYYIARNPKNFQCHRKLMKTCKLLFRMSRIVPVQELYSLDNNQRAIEMFSYWYSTPTKYDDKTIQYDDLVNPTFYKLWIHQYFRASDKSMPSLASSLTQHIHKCSVFALTLCYQELTIGELQILAAGDKLEKLIFTESIVKNGDGSITEFGEVFDVLKSTNMRITFSAEEHGVGKETARRIGEILEAEKKTFRIDLLNLPQNLDIEALLKFFKANMANRKHSIDLEFADTISADYKNHLQQCVNEIIQIRDIPGHAVPMISFEGHDDAAFEELCRMREDRYAGTKKNIVIANVCID